MSEQDDDLFPEDDDGALDDGFGVDAGAPAAPWIMLVVDDEPDIHAVTRMALDDVTFRGRPLEIIGAHSATEALEVLAARDDIAVMLLDVVMETDRAGLDLAREVRETLMNDRLRIVLRTGQPGQAPEREVILAFDINDYKAKTDLTADRLYTTVIAALRGYADIVALEEFRRDAYARVADQVGLVTRLIDMVPVPAAHLDTLGVVTACNPAFADLAGRAADDLIGESLADVLPDDIIDRLEDAPGDSTGGRVVVLGVSDNDGGAA